MDFIARKIDGEMYVSFDQVTKAIEEKNAEIENIKATHYAEMVDAGMRERKLKRALYKACANWANHAQLEEFGLVENWEKWENVERKSLAKVEEEK